VEATASAYVPAVTGVDPREPQDPRAALRRIVGGVALVAWVLAGLSWWSSGSIDWTIVGFAGAMWAAYSFLTTIVDNLAGLGRFIGNQFTGNVALPVPQDTIDDQRARLERMLVQPLERHREILIGIRLAEIYRTHQLDEAKSAALLERLRAKYPDAPELFHNDRLGMPESIDDQVARYERMLQGPLEPHQAVLIGIRLAEIYRTLQHDDAKADALLARIRETYPNAPELSHAGPG
jgi:tetratricopeptide repeat protein